jgi:hypothetical protein
MRRGYPNVEIYPSHSRDGKPLQFSLPIQIVTPIDAKQCWEQFRLADRDKRPRASEIGRCKENLLGLACQQGQGDTRRVYGSVREEGILDRGRRCA